MWKEKSANGKTFINLICSLLVLATNLIISFWMSPFIIKNIGVEANGFVTLANNFVMYAQLIVTALNSMAARFIAIAYTKNNIKKANLYYNSVFWGNLFICAILIIPATFFITKLDKFLNMPANITFDVKTLFTFVFANFFITTGFPNWDCGTFVTNRLDRSYVPTMIASVIKCIFIFVTLSIWIPHVFYVGLAATIMTIIKLIFDGYNTHKLTPELKIKWNPFICSKRAIKELVGAGIWNSISNVGNVLLTGLDILISNIFLGAAPMGIISISKIFDNLIGQLASSIIGVFNVEVILDYANGNNERLLKNINRSMKITSILITIPVTIFVIIGKDFFSLWVPNQDAMLLEILSIFAVGKYFIISSVPILWNIFPAVNKVKGNAISMIVTGVMSCLLTIIILKFTNWGIYAIAGISTLCALARNLIYVLPNAAKYLGLKWNVFYKDVLTSIESSVILLIIELIIKKGFIIHSWITLIGCCTIMGIIGFTVDLFIILNKNERKYVFDKINILKKVHV